MGWSRFKKRRARRWALGAKISKGMAKHRRRMIAEAQRRGMTYLIPSIELACRNRTKFEFPGPPRPAPPPPPPPTPRRSYW